MLIKRLRSKCFTYIGSFLINLVSSFMFSISYFMKYNSTIKTWNFSELSLSLQWWLKVLYLIRDSLWDVNIYLLVHGDLQLINENEALFPVFLSIVNALSVCLEFLFDLVQDLRSPILQLKYFLCLLFLWWRLANDLSNFKLWTYLSGF